MCDGERALGVLVRACELVARESEGMFKCVCLCWYVLCHMLRPAAIIKRHWQCVYVCVCMCVLYVCGLCACVYADRVIAHTSAGKVPSIMEGHWHQLDVDGLVHSEFCFNRQQQQQWANKTTHKSGVYSGITPFLLYSTWESEYQDVNPFFHWRFV